MFKSLLAGTALVILPLAASAADLPSRAMAPVLAQAPVFSWTGCYVGGTVGAAGLTSAAEGRYDNTRNYSGYDAKGTGSAATAGVTVGCNYQMNNIVLGAEGDYSFAMGGASGSEYGRDSGVSGYGSTYFQSVRTSMRGLGTVRARAGVAMDKTLVYVTAGLAAANVSTYYSSDESSNMFVRYNTTKFGWAVGAGVEQALTDKISLKLEALYADFGSKTTNMPAVTSTSLVKIKDSALIGRTGVNFKF